MPSSITHAYFSMDIFDRLNYNKRKLLSQYKEQLKTFAQGPDVFFFYKFFCPAIGKAIRDFGYYMQQNETQAFFVNLITYIKQHKLNKKPDVIAFLYGFISHYVLDMTIHPYVVYKTGIFNRKDKSTYKYAGGHTQLEVYIDAYMIQIRNKIKPAHFKTHKFCFNAISLSPELANLIDEVFDETFHQKAMGTIYIESIKHMKIVYKLFRNDRIGLKKCLYRISDFLPFNINMKVLSYYIKLDKNDYYLNLSKDHWHHPLNINIMYHYSVIELYAIALSKATKLIKEVDDVLNNKQGIEHLSVLFPNLSYLTGYDCKLGTGTYFSY
jgi:hypothetical protein